MEPLVTMVDISKSFGHILANDQVSFGVTEGEVHSLLGENGAGKTTLMNILSGLYKPDKGEINFKGRKVDIKCPKDAIRLGIHMVHQQFMLFPTFTVLENIVAGERPILEREDFQRDKKKLEPLLEEFKLDPSAKVGELPIGAQQRLEILKSLYRNAKLLILDEPTSVLVPAEVEGFFNLLRSFTAKGTSIIFISHKIKEVMAISQRTTVIRRGRVIHTLRTAEASENELIQMMIGEPISNNYECKRSCKEERPILEVRNLTTQSDNKSKALHNVSLSLHCGEILGIAGMDGNGQKELAEAIIGLRKATEGQIIIEGKNCTNLTPAERLKIGLAYAPEDCLNLSLFGDLNLCENLFVKNLHTNKFFTKKFFVSKGILKRVEYETATIIKNYGIRGELVTPLKSLSGGNRQKFSMEVAFSSNPKLLVALYPTKGLDVKSLQNVQKKFIEESRKGLAIIFFSNELSEIFSVSDRIAVMYEGRIMSIFGREEADVKRVGGLMAGIA